MKRLYEAQRYFKTKEVEKDEISRSDNPGTSGSEANSTLPIQSGPIISKCRMMQTHVLARTSTSQSKKAFLDRSFNIPVGKRYSLKESGESRLGSKARPITALQSSLDNWFARNVDSLKTIMRVIFGIVWAIDGAFKLQPGFADTFQSFISSAPSNQPAWLQGWFSFWASITSSNTTLFFYSVATIELGLAFCLIFGFLRKLAYTIGILFSLLLWSVPEGFGGPYGPSSTDIGTGIIYAFVFIFLLIINATKGPSKYSLDYLIEKKWPSWKRIAEIRSSP